MIITKKDSDGRVIAYAEFRMVNEVGMDDPKGIYIWINDVWVHDAYKTKNKFNAILAEFIKAQSINYPWAEYAYWQRGKYKDRMSLYSRTKILRRPINGKTTKAGHDSATATFAYANTTTI